jgi:hypothetical protein
LVKRLRVIIKPNLGASLWSQPLARSGDPDRGEGIAGKTAVRVAKAKQAEIPGKRAGGHELRRAHSICSGIQGAFHETAHIIIRIYNNFFYPYFKKFLRS